MIVVNHVVVSLFIAEEVSVSVEAPDFTDFLALVIVEDITVHVVELVNPCTGIPDAGLYVVVEVFSPGFE